MKYLQSAYTQSRSDICAGDASTRLRRHGARSFLRSRSRSTLAARERCARTSRNNSSRAGSFSCRIWLWQTCGRGSQSTRRGAPTHELHYVQKLAARADNNLVALSAAALSTSRLGREMRFACELCGEACWIKNARTSSPQLIRVIYARESLEAITTISCHAHLAPFSDPLTAIRCLQTFVP